MKQSAGCIVVKVFDNVPHILLVHSAGNWKIKQFGIPKGRVGVGESLSLAAARETEEESGITPEIIEYIGYVVRNVDPKRVHAFLAKVHDGKIDDKKRTVGYDKNEVDVSKFYPVEQAAEMVYEYQKPLLERAKKHIRKNINAF